MNFLKKLSLSILAMTLGITQSSQAGTISDKAGIYQESSNPGASGFHSPRSLTTWYSQNGALNGSSPVTTATSTQKVVAYGNFGGVSRYIMRDSSNGGQLWWNKADEPWNGWTPIGYSNLGSSNEYIGVADFNGDGIDDIVVMSGIQNASQVWHMNTNGTVASTKPFGFGANSGLKFFGVGNNDSSGKPDIWQQDTLSGVVSVYQVVDNGTTYMPDTLVNGGRVWKGQYPVSTYNFTSVGDYDGDGDNDLLANIVGSNNAVIIKTQGGSIIPGNVQISGLPQIGVGMSPTTLSPKLLISNPTIKVGPLMAGGSNSAVAKDLGTINVGSVSTVNSEVMHNSVSDYVKFTTTAPMQVTLSFGNADVWGYNSNANGAQSGGGFVSWGQIGLAPGNPNNTTTSSSFSIPAGTHYFRVLSRKGGSTAPQMIPYTFTVNARAVPTPTPAN